MWFAKWFGGRKNAHEEDEPARFPPSAVPHSATNPRPQPSPAKPKTSVVRAEAGFDPYNSGAFVKHNAWERTNLR
jgi:hypothetical protein